MTVLLSASTIPHCVKLGKALFLKSGHYKRYLVEEIEKEWESDRIHT
jgi:hypothetical protein